MNRYCRGAHVLQRVSYAFLKNQILAQGLALGVASDLPSFPWLQSHLQATCCLLHFLLRASIDAAAYPSFARQRLLMLLLGDLLLVFPGFDHERPHSLGAV